MAKGVRSHRSWERRGLCFFVYCPGSFSQPAGNALPTPRGHRGTPPRSASGTAGGGGRGGQVWSESFASTLFLYAKR